MLMLGTFLIAFALLFFEVFSTIVVSFVLGSGYIYFVIGIAMLGLSAAASVMSILSSRMDEAAVARWLYRGCALLALTLIANLLLFVQIKDQLNLGIEAAARLGGLDGIVAKILADQLWMALALGATMSVPYMIFGAVITLIFKQAPPEQFHRIYFADMVGAALGCVCAIISLEWGGYALTALIPIVVALLAGAAYLGRQVRPLTRRAAVAVSLVPLTLLAPAAVTWIEPAPQLNSLARDYDMTQKVTELWHGWNSYSRVGALHAVASNGAVESVMALGNGEGHAQLIPYSPEGYGDWKQRLAIIGTAMGAPEDALVLFAGTGSDMQALDDYTRGQSRITGVELNHTMVAGGLGQPQYRLGEFYAKPNIRMVVSEAREFLERDDNRYDAILLSWSGATVAYYAGSIGHTTQFVYTREAFESMIDHLKPGGFIVVWNTNKVNTLAAFRAIMEERGMPNVPSSAVVLHIPGSETSDWKRNWDSNPLIFKPSGFTAMEVEQLAAAGSRISMKIAYAPGADSDPEFYAYREVLTAPNLDRVLRKLSDDLWLRFSVVDDDRPFSLDLFRTDTYLSSDFWGRLIGHSDLKPYESYRAQQTVFVLVLLLAAVVLIVGPLAIRGGPPLSRNSAQHLVYFSVCGMGFMLVEIGLVHKMGLLLGNPALSIAIVLAGLIFFTGVGSLFSQRLFSWGLNFQSCVLFIVVYLIVFLLASDRLVSGALAWALAWRILLALLILAPAGLAMGQLFPQGLVRASRDGTALLPWAWAINGAMGTIAAGLAPLVAQAVGFRLLVLSGAAFYLLILLLPEYRKRAVPVLAPQPV